MAAPLTQVEKFADLEEWEAPDYYRIDADEAQANINPGPEILILIS